MEEDLPGLAALLAGSFGEPWDVARVRRDLTEDPTVVRTFVIAEGDRILATASSRLLPDVYPGVGYLHWVASDPERRGEGLGLNVVVAVLHDVAARGLAGCVLETDDDRLSALRLYLGLGFVPVMREPDHELRWSLIFPQLFAPRSKAAR